MKKRLFPSISRYRLAEIMVPITVWLTITMPLWLSPFHPAIASYLILAYFLYFLYKASKTIYYSFISYALIKKAEKTNWLKKLQKSKGHDAITHFILIFNYKESAQKLEKTIQAIVDQEYDHQKIHILMAMEKREEEIARERTEYLKGKFLDKCAGFHATYHPLLEGEVIGKASNGAYAAKYVSDYAVEHGIDPKKVILTICDADSLLPPYYLAYVTYKFLEDKDRDYRFFWAPVLLYANFWSLPLPVRVQSILSSVSRFAYLSQHDELIQISTYSTNLWLLEQVGYWDTDIIPEDWHIWLQAFFKFGEKVKTIPIYLLITSDGILAEGLWRTLKTRYSQERRWAWGASDIPYAIKRSFETPHINPMVKLRRILFITENHFNWPISFFILNISASIPALVNPVFQRTVLGFLLPKLSSFILSIASVFLIAIIYFDYQLRKRLNVKTKLSDIPMLFIQWYFLPIISFFFSSLPALESHTRMLLGKKLEYKVTEKV